MNKITHEQLVIYSESVSIEDHEAGCPFGQPDGPDDFFKDCECSDEHILQFLNRENNGDGK